MLKTSYDIMDAKMLQNRKSKTGKDVLLRELACAVIQQIHEYNRMNELSRASVQSYLPYSKTVYKLEERTLLAECLVKYHVRKSAVQKIAEAMESDNAEGMVHDQVDVPLYKELKTGPFGQNHPEHFRYHK